MEELEQVRAERDLYRRLARLAGVSDPRSFLARLLDLAADAAGARYGYVELGPDAAIAFSSGIEDLSQVRRALSTGVLQQAVLQGRVVATDDAAADPELSVRESVHRKGVEAVLCAPIGDPAIGVIYLQRQRGDGPFDPRVTGLVADLVACLEPLARRILDEATAAADPTAPWRQALAGTDGVIGRSEALGRALREVALYAPLDKTVLALGPSGSGKTQLMELVHRNSRRSARPWVVIDAPSLGSEIAAAELFGSVRGAFTGAVDREGAVARAHGGTLFLDEVGELKPDVQTLLLRFLQSGEYRRVGESRTRQADVRVLAATHRDLEALVGEGGFREDLYYRLAQVVIRVPSLAERTEDVLRIAEWQLVRFCREQGWPAIELGPAAQRALQDEDWSAGGVRRLCHLVDRAAIHAHAEGVPIAPRHLFPQRAPAEDEDATPTWHEATRAFQRRLLQETLERCDGNVTAAARTLDLDRSYVHRMLRSA